MQANFQLLTWALALVGGLQLPFTESQTSDNIVCCNQTGPIIPPHPHKKNPRILNQYSLSSSQVVTHPLCWNSTLSNIHPIISCPLLLSITSEPIWQFQNERGRYPVKMSASQPLLFLFCFLKLDSVALLLTNPTLTNSAT